MTDQACGCEADSGDPDYQCDCEMQGSCICSHDCTCKSDVCKEAVSQLTIIECAVDGQNNKAELCKQKEITGYPSWEINGKIISGIQSLKELALRSNFNNLDKL